MNTVSRAIGKGEFLANALLPFDAGVAAGGNLQDATVGVDPDHATRRNGFGEAGSDGTGPAADIHQVHTWLQMREEERRVAGGCAPAVRRSMLAFKPCCVGARNFGFGNRQKATSKGPPFGG
jgi:hypothetical protein